MAKPRIMPIPVKRLKQEYARERRVIVPNFLDPVFAEEVYESLKSMKPEHWYECHNDQKHSTYARHRYLRYLLKNATLHLKYTDRRKLRHKAPERELGGRHPLIRLSQLLNSGRTHDLLAKVIGESLTPGKFLCFAACYRKGDFNELHNDGAYPRRIAFVLYLTKDWKKSWGGNLVFPGKKAFSPRFNTAVFFEVPAKHAVSRVNTKAKARRYTVAGWYHDYSKRAFRDYVRRAKTSRVTLW